MVSTVLAEFVRAVFGYLRREARKCGIEQAQCGAVTFVQRFGGSLNAIVHFHMLTLDGVYAPKPAGKPEFFALRGPETSDIVKLTEVLAARIPAAVKAPGRSMMAARNKGTG